MAGTEEALFEGKTIGFLGAGAMATAMIQGLISSGKVAPSSIIACDPFAGCRDRAAALGCCVTESNAAVGVEADIVIVAVKPNVVKAALLDLALASRDSKKEHPLVVSIAAGVPIAVLEDAVRCEGARIVRTMPNTPCLIGEAAVGLAAGPTAAPGDVAITAALFTGVTVEVAEKDLDAVTALSGSGPAYVFLFIEALADAGVRAGLARPVALKLAAQTVKGAAAMQLHTGTHPALLKDQVCSPGGTTIAGVEALEKNGFRHAAMSAVAAANGRSKELAAAALNPK